MSALSQFAAFFQGGGPFMYIILGIGVLGFALALERFWTISKASSWNGGKITNDMSERVRKGDLQGAAAIAKKVKSPIGQVAHAIVTSGARTEESLLNTADGETAVAVAPLTRRLPQIALLANTATLLGLLGTIFGLTTAFSAVGAADPSQRSAFLAAGISQALNTTAFGLIIAIPGLLVHGFLAGRVERIMEQVDDVTVKLIRAMMQASGARPSQGAQAPAATPAPAQPQATTPGRPQPVR